jgi:hypothetical protein
LKGYDVEDLRVSQQATFAKTVYDADIVQFVAPMRPG